MEGEKSQSTKITHNMSEDNIENLPSIEDYKDNSDELPSVEELVTEQELPSVEAVVEK